MHTSLIGMIFVYWGIRKVMLTAKSLFASPLIFTHIEIVEQFNSGESKFRWHRLNTEFTHTFVAPITKLFWSE